MSNEKTPDTIEQKPPTRSGTKLKLVSFRGRSRIYATPEEASAARNERRRVKYKADAQYRAQTLKMSRRYYRDNNATSAAVDHLALTDKSEISALGSSRRILQSETPSTGSAITFNAAESAVVFGGYNSQVIYRWIRAGQVPQMTTKAVCLTPQADGVGHRKNVCTVYTLDEIHALATVLSSHQERVRYFKISHRTTISKLNNAVMSVRTGGE